MLDILFAIALALCWMLGFFVLAQFLYQQFEISKKLDEMNKNKCQNPDDK